MTQHFRIDIEQAKALTVQQERDLLRAALTRNPSSELLKMRLAFALFITDRFEDVIDLLTGPDAPMDSDLALLLAQSYLARETASANLLAAQASERALALASEPEMRASALATLGKAQTRLGDYAAARATLRAALDENPHDKDAWKRLAMILMNLGAAEEVLDLADRMLARGVAHARLFVSRTLALAKLGRIEEARAYDNHARFASRRILEPPEGWPSIAAFNEALAAELVAHPGLRYERYGTASTKSWRIDEPATGGSPLVAALNEQMRRFMAGFVDGLAGVDHDWARARPAAGKLHSWCVMTDGPGFEEWHVHQSGWLTGVYYVAVPEMIARGNGNAGCIGFGLPEDLIGKAAADAYGLELIRPTAGLMMLFPSHVFHRTFPHQARERRICLAFDLWPA